MKKKLKLVSIVFFAFVVTGCQTLSEHVKEVDTAQQADDKITIGKVQREIRVGMSNAEVIEVLGSPNMVTTDSQRRENWVYDKISTRTVYSSSSGGINALVLGGGGAFVGGGLGASSSRATGAHSTNQRTLTIIVKFDQENKVRDFAYRSSSF